jgi:hypothetical protein
MNGGLRHEVRTATSLHTQTPIQWVLRALCTELKRPEREINHSALRSEGIMNDWSYASNSSVLSLCHGQNFTSFRECRENSCGHVHDSTLQYNILKPLLYDFTPKVIVY